MSKNNKGNLLYIGNDLYQGEVWHPEGVKIQFDKTIEGKVSIYNKEGQKLAEYEGDFQDEIPTGEGKITYCLDKKGIREIYEGSVKDCIPQGKGSKSFYKDEVLIKKHEGTFKNNQLEGKGIKSYFDGKGNLTQKCEGTFKKNKCIKGKITFENGNTYEGPLKNEKFHDRGKYTMMLKGGCRAIFSGTFINGKLNGDVSITTMRGKTTIWFETKTYKDGKPIKKSPTPNTTTTTTTTSTTLAGSNKKNPKNPAL